VVAQLLDLVLLGLQGLDVWGTGRGGGWGGRGEAQHDTSVSEAEQPVCSSVLEDKLTSDAW
jgi:hypothetical protein